MRDNWSVLYEDNHLLAVDKPSGLLTQGDISGESSLLDQLKEYLKERYDKPGNVFLGLVHRLDRPVSGVLVFARTSRAAARLFRQFQERSVIKLYLAVVSGRTGELSPPGEGWTRLTQGTRREKDITVITPEGTGQAASLEYRSLFEDNGRALLLIRLLTGRKHQIRAQLASLSLPIIGDGKYGSSKPCAPGAIGLHAAYLRFRHPTRDDDVELSAAPPAHFIDLLPPGWPLPDMASLVPSP